MEPYSGAELKQLRSNIEAGVAKRAWGDAADTTLRRLDATLSEAERALAEHPGHGEKTCRAAINRNADRVLELEHTLAGAQNDRQRALMQQQYAESALAEVKQLWLTEEAAHTEDHRALADTRLALHTEIETVNALDKALAESRAEVKALRAALESVWLHHGQAAPNGCCVCDARISAALATSTAHECDNGHVVIMRCPKCGGSGSELSSNGEEFVECSAGCYQGNQWGPCPTCYPNEYPATSTASPRMQPTGSKCPKCGGPADVLYDGGIGTGYVCRKCSTAPEPEEQP